MLMCKNVHGWASEKKEDNFELNDQLILEL